MIHVNLGCAAVSNPQATKVIIQDDASRAEISRGAQQQNLKGG